MKIYLYTTSGREKSISLYQGENPWIKHLQRAKHTNYLSNYTTKMKTAMPLLDFFFNMKTTIRNLPSSKRCLDQVTTFIITIAQIHNACKMLSSTWCKSNKKCRRNLYFHQSRSQKQHHSNNQMLHPTQKQIVQQNHPFGL